MEGDLCHLFISKTLDHFYWTVNKKLCHFLRFQEERFSLRNVDQDTIFLLILILLGHLTVKSDFFRVKGNQVDFCTQANLLWPLIASKDFIWNRSNTDHGNRNVSDHE